MKSKFPLIIIFVGIIILGIGIWQIADVNTQTSSSLQKAKEIIAEKPVEAQEKNPNKGVNIGANKSTNNSTHLIVGDIVGILAIPKIKAELAIVEGTNPDDLKKGVGHYKGSYFPKDNGQIVLSGHRDTVFRHLGELKIGDTLEIKMPYGSFTYTITHTKIVDSKDTSIITLQHKQEELILTTCYPFHYIGNAPKRYIIYAKPK
ncbi:class D sortase [Neobacillus pocheonensis]|uniref:Class D sortase n=1 Tax=Neobacillus pocheonensis TaxID=363869 RepID=A0ABT0W556_9BACI|nr:class D sortase [Neobacillus pocheonensis]